MTSKKLTESIKIKTSENSLAFYDAIAPIVYEETINMSVAWKQSRYDKGSGDDYINCPLSKNEYYQFIEKIKKAPKMEFKEFEDTPFFEGCMPIEEIIRRGDETLRYGPMKPVGLKNPHKKEEPYAVVQLRQDNKSGTLYNIVGFQTKMKHGAQKEIFKTIPGLENSEFARLGGLHRNTFIKSPKLLDPFLRLKNSQNIIFAGQITGVEGYVESSAIGFIAGIIAAYDLKNKNLDPATRTPASKSNKSYLLQISTWSRNLPLLVSGFVPNFFISTAFDSFPIGDNGCVSFGIFPISSCNVSKSFSVTSVTSFISFLI